MKFIIYAGACPASQSKSGFRLPIHEDSDCRRGFLGDGISNGTENEKLVLRSPAVVWDVAAEAKSTIFGRRAGGTIV
jgi:hypothetical protein